MAAYSRKFGILATTLVFGALAVPAFAQPAPDAPAPASQPGEANPGGGNPGGRPDPAQFDQRMLELRRRSLARVQEMLGSSDDEFKVLQPKLENLFHLTRELQGGGIRALSQRGGGNGGGGGGGGGGQDQTPTPLQVKLKDLQDTLENKDAKPDDVKTKLQAYRDARALVKAELDKARAEVKDLLTAKQEAVLVELGLLE